ncbi:DJ-1 family protein [Clostridium sp. AF19-22AC]|uniref:4-methyl-5(B-hydroxyethyl)-thiazole monophosphate biosynthesis n=1 Tax=Faecalicatena orotica TaxID=1544 RepID=A0A2Y9C487_9FIRM|nr:MULTISPECIES: DJ-1 family glyoxalase III [Clostridia]PWJ32148.1 4-methyl-5(b-hydroxyethyl)-thiazole monophosphate biosynthesis [Faecalicatena orotica]RHR31996.1 DJ-1 family protein [Clostridium sp. AF19-22AC]SSA53981.1 4-methyl-5(b-hydroxyethyl)-thiazole monophosphate biosynthesis [Faecalicatena orotica]
MKRVSVFLADGFEEIEGLTVVDLLRRAGVHVDTVSVSGSLVIHGAHGIGVNADVLFGNMDFSDVDMLVLPGGMPGTVHLQEHAGLEELLKEFYEKQAYIAAICAAPSILGALGFLKGRTACSYPSMEGTLTGADVVRESVAVDGHIITSRGMGTAIPFALTLISILCGQEKADEVSESVIYA